MPDIVVINETTSVAATEIQAMLEAFDQQWNRDLRPIWGVGPATFALLPRAETPAPGTWWMVFLDNSEQAGALAYHDLTNDGLPIAKVFVEAVLADGASISVRASHEICEIAVDPWLNSAYQDSAGTFWAAEVCDPVADDAYGYRIGEVLVTDFVTPAWFGHHLGDGRMDLRDHVDAPFQVLSGGYAQRFQAGVGWVQVTGVEALRSGRGKTALAGCRRERRARQAVQPMKRSRHSWT